MGGVINELRVGLGEINRQVPRYIEDYKMLTGFGGLGKTQIIGVFSVQNHTRIVLFI